MDLQIGLSYTASITINISYCIAGLQAESLALTGRDGLPYPWTCYPYTPIIISNSDSVFFVEESLYKLLIESYDQGSCTWKTCIHLPWGIMFFFKKIFLQIFSYSFRNPLCKSVMKWSYSINILWKSVQHFEFAQYTYLVCIISVHLLFYQQPWPFFSF